MTKISKDLTPDELNITQKGVQRAFEEITGLSKKVTFNDYRKVPDYLLSSPKNIINSIKDETTKTIENKIAYSVSEGFNAFFIDKIPCWYKESFEKLGFKPNSINVNMEKLPIAAFHEMGHAFNSHCSSFWKSIQKFRGISKFAPLIALIPAFTKEFKPKNGEELTKKQKRHNTFRKYTPLIAGAMFIPTLAEEAKATLRGNKWAKEVYSNAANLANKVIKFNRLGMLSYASAALLTVLLGCIAKEVKDFSDKKKEKTNVRFAHQG